MKYFFILFVAIFLSSCESEITSNYDQYTIFKQTDLTTDYNSPFNKTGQIDKTGELECWEYPAWSVSDFGGIDFNQGSCSSKLSRMASFGWSITSIYTDEILGYCGEYGNCARPTESIEGIITVNIDNNGDFNGNLVWGDILSVAKSLYRAWQVQQGPGPNGEIAFICNRASITEISLDCNNTPNSTISVTFVLFLDGQVTYRCDVCEEDTDTAPGPIGPDPGGSCC